MPAWVSAAIASARFVFILLNAVASVLFCLSDRCGWREWTVLDTRPDVRRLAKQCCKPGEIAARLGIRERSAFGG